MEMFCAAKVAVENENTIELSVFILQKWILEEGTKLEQRRDNLVIATWELISHTSKSITLKKLSTSIEFGDMFYAESPVIEVPKIEAPTTNVFVFSGKNWKLASPKKWVPMELLATSVRSGMKEILGDINIKGKDCDVCRIVNGMEETMFVAVPKPLPEIISEIDNPVNIE